MAISAQRKAECIHHLEHMIQEHQGRLASQKGCTTCLESAIRSLYRQLEHVKSFRVAPTSEQGC